MRRTFTTQTTIHPPTLPHRTITHIAHSIPTLHLVRQIAHQDQRMLVIHPILSLGKRSASNVEIELARAAVVREPMPRIAARVAGELPVGVGRREEEAQRVVRVAAVADAAREVEAEVVEEEGAFGLAANVGGARRNVDLAAGADCVVVVVDL